MQGFCNKLFENTNEIFGWDPKKGNNNVERGTVVAEDALEVSNIGGSMPKGEVKKVQGKYYPTPPPPQMKI